MAWDPDRLRRAFNPPAEHYDVRGTVAFALTLANRAFRQYVAMDRFELGLHEGRDLVMVELARLAGRATSSELASSLGLTPSTLSTLVRRSEEEGLLRRDRDGDDSRVWRLSLTSEGLVRAYGGAALWRSADEALRQALSEADLTWLRVLAREAGSAWDEARSASLAETEAALREEAGSG